MHDHEPVAEIFDEREQVGAEQDRAAGRGVFADDGLDGADAHRIEARQGLIEHEQARLVEERCADRGLLAHAAGEVRRDGVALGGELESLEELIGAGFPAGEFVRRGDEAEVFEDGEVVEQFRIVGDVGEALLGFDRPGADVESADAGGAGRGSEDAGDAAHRGGLAGAVGADQGDDAAWVDRSGGVVQRGELLVALGEVVELENRRLRRRWG